RHAARPARDLDTGRDVQGRIADRPADRRPLARGSHPAETCRTDRTRIRRLCTAADVYGLAVGKRCSFLPSRENGSRESKKKPPHASNMITLRTVLPAFIAAKPSLISDSFSRAEIQSSRCSRPRM